MLFRSALDLLYSARLIDADEALRMGLVSRVIPPDDLLGQVLEYAALLATSVSPRSLRVIKKQVYNSLFCDLGDAIETANEEMIQSFQCEDFKEGVAHFVEKRPPKFSGKIGRAQSELQSRRNLVCRLLLEKKKYNSYNN